MDDGHREPTRVLHVAAVPEFVRRILLHDIRRHTSNVRSRVLCAEGRDLDFVRAEGIDVVPIRIQRKLSPLADLVSIVDIVREIRRFRPDILHTYTPKPGLLGQIAGVLTKVPVRIHSCRGLLYEPGLPEWRRRLYRSTDRLTNLLAHHTTFLSRADLELSVRERLCRRSKALHLGTGIDLAHFQRSPDWEVKRKRTRQSLGYADDDVVVLSVGRYVREKGYADIAAAAALLRTNCPQLRWLWVAPVVTGEEGVLSASLPDSVGAGDRVQVLPLQDDMIAAYAAADILVHASYREGVPRVVMEAGALGIPLVVSDIPGCLEIVEPGQSGIVFQAGDEMALADAVQECLADPDLTARRSASALHIMRERFDANILAERIMAMYESALGSHSNRPSVSASYTPVPGRW